MLKRSSFNSSSLTASLAYFVLFSCSASSFASDDVPPQVVSPNARPWKKVLTPILGKVTGEKVLQHGYLDFGRQAQPETICVVYQAAYLRNVDFGGGKTMSLLYQKANAALRRLRTVLPPGFVAFVGTNRFLHSGWSRAGQRRGEVEIARLELAVGPGSSQFDIVKLAGTEPVNYSMTTGDVITRLQAVDRYAGIDISQACFDTLTFSLRKTPADKYKLAKLILKVCPELHPAYCPDEFPNIKPNRTEVRNYEAFVHGLEKGAKILLWWD